MIRQDSANAISCYGGYLIPGNPKVWLPIEVFEGLCSVADSLADFAMLIAEYQKDSAGAWHADSNRLHKEHVELAELGRAEAPTAAAIARQHGRSTKSTGEHREGVHHLSGSTSNRDSRVVDGTVTPGGADIPEGALAEAGRAGATSNRDVSEVDPAGKDVRPPAAFAPDRPPTPYIQPDRRVTTAEDTASATAAAKAKADAADAAAAKKVEATKAAVAREAAALKKSNTAKEKADAERVAAERESVTLDANPPPDSGPGELGAP